MDRKYPAKLFWFNVLTDFLFYFFYLLISGIILSIVGIWVKLCLLIGLSILGLDLILSIIKQLRIRKTFLTLRDNPELNELIDAFSGPDGLETFRESMNAKIAASSCVDSQEDED